MVHGGLDDRALNPPFLLVSTQPMYLTSMFSSVSGRPRQARPDASPDQDVTPARSTALSRVEVSTRVAPVQIYSVRPTTRSVTNLMGWHFRDRPNSLDMVLSTEWEQSLAPRCADLVGNFTRIPITSHYFINPYQAFLGPSWIAGAGRGLFFETDSSPVLQASVVLPKYCQWGYRCFFSH